jgi:murein L,D-transpeptidase YcbB/YkuD
LFGAAALGLLTVSAAPPTASAPTPESAASFGFTAAQADLLVRALAGAADHGLDPERFRVGPRTLKAAALDYAVAVHSGALPRSAFPGQWAQRPDPFDPEPGLAEALARDGLAAWLAALPPQGARYADLRSALVRYRAYAAGGGWKAVPTGKALRAGDQDERIRQLRARLAAEGDASIDTGSNLFDADLSAALTRFQRLHGVGADGVLGSETVAALNVPVAARINQIVANMERLRWETREPAATRIEVDSGSAVLSFYRRGVLALSMRTIVGRPADPTPMFRDQVEAVVLNPPWNVPVGIAVREILPKARRDGAYLVRNDFVVRPGPGPVEARLQQRPGPKSALGFYKFDMPNGFNVYLHDTPARSLFDGDKRNLSHGCVRLQRPRELAEMILGDDQAMTAEAIAAALGEGVTRRIPLRRPIPVSVSYWTVSGAGEEVAFRPDLYRWDARLAALLAQAR